jgi:lipopolysaccharide export system protein LptA
MYCDSAYFFEKENSLHAFGNVHMVQGDTIEGFGDALYYNGNTKMARLRSNVKLIHQNTILTTDSLNYDRKNNIAYYFSDGTIKDSVNVLTSRWGQYSPDNHQAIFRGNVKLVNSKFLLTADTLEYNTESYQSDLVGPTEILYEKETTIYSSNGWYNTQSELSMLLDRSQIIHADGTTLTGDTIYYDKKAGYGNSFGNIESCDSANHLTLYGHRGEVWDNGNRGYVTDSAMLLDWSDTTAFTYMHADTLWSENVPYQVYSILPRDSILVDSILMPQLPDTLWQDTTYHQLRAFYNVRIYNEDI